MQLYNSRRIQHIEGERDLNAVSRLLTTFKEFEVNTDLRGLCNTMISIVNTYARHNRFAKGLEFLEEKSLEISDGSKWHEAMSQAMKGYLLRKLGKSDAEEPLCESLKTMHAFDMCPPLSPEGTGWLALRPDLVLGDDHPQVKALGHVREFDVFPLTRDELKRIEHRASALIL